MPDPKRIRREQTEENFESLKFDPPIIVREAERIERPPSWHAKTAADPNDGSYPRAGNCFWITFVDTDYDDLAAGTCPLTVKERTPTATTVARNIGDLHPEEGTLVRVWKHNGKLYFEYGESTSASGSGSGSGDGDGDGGSGSGSSGGSSGSGDGSGDGDGDGGSGSGDSGSGDSGGSGSGGSGGACDKQFADVPELGAGESIAYFLVLTEDGCLRRVAPGQCGTGSGSGS